MRSPQSSTDSTNLSSSKLFVVSALANGATVTDAAKRAQVDRSTIYNWIRADADFLAELNRAKREQMERLRGQLMELANDAFQTFRQVLTDSSTPAAVRLKAASTILQALGAYTKDEIGETDAGEIRYKEFKDSLTDF